MQCPITNKRARIDLVDDGTMDTVFICTGCGGEFRFNFDGEGSYTTFKAWAREDAAFQHVSE